MCSHLKKKCFDSLAEALGPICEFIKAFCSLFRAILFGALIIKIFR
jgi:hypothetical protein